MAITKAEVLTEYQENRGCLGKAADDEPIFVLRAQDKFSATLIRTWASLLEELGPATEEVAAKISEAHDIAEAMIAWPNRKVPD